MTRKYYPKCAEHLPGLELTALPPFDLEPPFGQRTIHAHKFHNLYAPVIPLLDGCSWLMWHDQLNSVGFHDDDALIREIRSLPRFADGEVVALGPGLLSRTACIPLHDEEHNLGLWGYRDPLPDFEAEAQNWVRWPHTDIQKLYAYIMQGEDLTGFFCRDPEIVDRLEEALSPEPAWSTRRTSLEAEWDRLEALTIEEYGTSA